MRGVKRIDLLILTDFHILNPSEYEKLILGTQSVCLSTAARMDGRMCASLAPGRLGGFYSYSVFISLSFTDRWPVNTIHCSSENRSPSNRRQKRQCRFPRKHLQQFWLNFSNLWRSSSYIKLHRRYLHESNSTRAGSNVDFIETSLIGRTDLVVVRYTGTNYGLSTNNIFSFHHNVVRINRIRPSKVILAYFLILKK
jgi:hypothetical protein